MLSPKTHATTSSQATGFRSRTPDLVIAVAVTYWIFQVAWFWRYCAHNINVDAISYIGIARHIAAGDFLASLHGYWSPLISWLIAAAQFAGADWTSSARLLMLPFFPLCQILLYWLTQKLWNSRLLSALAVLWFTAARSVAAFSVEFIGADLLLTAVVLLYFILLLERLERPESLPGWFGLGVVHGIAFLAKAVAMPLFACTTLAAVISSTGNKPKRAAAALALAAVFPALTWVAWGRTLQQKYGVFTTGYQLRWNLLDSAARQARENDLGLNVLLDTRASYDNFMVTEQMPPASRLWRVRVWRPGLIGQIADKELRNIPSALKELFILLTPGGVLAVILCVVQLTRERRHSPSRFRFLWIVLLTTAALVMAYSMLVFDGRYVLPVSPLLMALGIRFALPPGEPYASKSAVSGRIADAGRWQTAAGLLLGLGLLGAQVYWSSPFRTIHRDFQRSVYAAAGSLSDGGAKNVVVIGKGPYPEHGVGWEAGFSTAYFAGARIVATLLEPSPGLNIDAVLADTAKLAPDAVMIWGSPSSSNYQALTEGLRRTYPQSKVNRIADPVKGEVCTIVLLRTAG